jgi:hypothetical protein
MMLTKHGNGMQEIHALTENHLSLLPCHNYMVHLQTNLIILIAVQTMLQHSGCAAWIGKQNFDIENSLKAATQKTGIQTGQ